MAGLLEVGPVPKVTRTHGRKRGKWRGHEHLAAELRILVKREKDPERAWGKVAERVNPTKAQAIVSAIKKGDAVGFEHTDGIFDALSRKSKNQRQAPTNKSTGVTLVLYDVWATFIPAK
jgi:hypothetical protein